MFENKYQHHLDEEGYVIIKFLSAVRNRRH